MLKINDLVEYYKAKNKALVSFNKSNKEIDLALEKFRSECGHRFDRKRYTSISGKEIVKCAICEKVINEQEIKS